MIRQRDLLGQIADARARLMIEGARPEDLQLILGPASRARLILEDPGWRAEGTVLGLEVHCDHRVEGFLVTLKGVSLG